MGVEEDDVDCARCRAKQHRRQESEVEREAAASRRPPGSEPCCHHARHAPAQRRHALSPVRSARGILFLICETLSDKPYQSVNRNVLIFPSVGFPLGTIRQPVTQASAGRSSSPGRYRCPRTPSAAAPPRARCPRLRPEAAGRAQPHSRSAGTGAPSYLSRCLDDTAIHLQLVERAKREEVEIRTAGSEVVDGQPEPGHAKTGQGFDEPRDIRGECRFRDFQHDAVRRHFPRWRQAGGPAGRTPHSRRRRCPR